MEIYLKKKEKKVKEASEEHQSVVQISDSEEEKEVEDNFEL